MLRFLKTSDINHMNIIMKNLSKKSKIKVNKYH